MIKKSIIAIVVIVAAAAMVFAAGSGNPDNSTSNSNEEIQQNAADNSSEETNETISAAKAKTIAEKYIEEPGASAGTPKLSKQDGKLVYTVPVIYNGETVGEIEIDAQTGKNLGGAGGVS